MPYIRQVERAALDANILSVSDYICGRTNARLSDHESICNLFQFTVKLSNLYIAKFGRRYVNFNSIAGVLSCVVKELKRIARMYNHQIGKDRYFNFGLIDKRQTDIHAVCVELIKPIEHVGQMNYVVSAVCHRLILLRHKISVADVCRAIGLASDFVYTNSTATYEDEKIKENGTISSWDFTIIELSK